MPADSAQHRVKDLFNEAVEHSPEARPAFLDSACGANADLRGQVERLLTALDDAPDFLETPPATDDFDLDVNGEDCDPDLIGRQIGHYHLRRMIATGGMGSVYEAVQEKPHRTVAVKVMKRGIASRSAMRRFEFESQILARMRHPAIAQVYEAGTWKSEGDVPYFVMEYVPGARPITDYARERKLTTSQRMELFASVCGAVHHGHQKGIIHRDLKPANILIDASGEPKIIDFGVARATDSDMAVTTLHTDVGQLIGTLQYMSPEQCQADPNDLDTRSDVYALGLVLYELLSEHLPYDITHAPVPEAVRVVKEEEPARPSSVNKSLRGDVETILLKALEKERDRRYSSAADLAADITRYLKHEPIVARPPSARYQLRKFVQRHKGLATGITAVFVVLVAASLVSTRLYLRAERQAAIAKAVNDFLNDDLLAAVSPEEQGREVTMREVLDVASENIEGRFPDEPLVEAAVLLTLGTTYRTLGLYDRAEPYLTEARRLRREQLGSEDPDTLESTRSLAHLYSRQGRYADAEPLYLQMLEIQTRLFGEEDPDTLASLHDLAQHYAYGHMDKAMPMYLKTLEMRTRVLGEEHPDTLRTMRSLAGAYKLQGRYDEAERLHLQTLEIRERVLGEEHPDTLGSMHKLAIVYARQTRYEEADRLFRRTLEIRKRVLGEEHPGTLASMNSVANMHAVQGRWDEAEALYRRTFALRTQVLGEDHGSTSGSRKNLARICAMQGRYDEAEPLFLRSVESERRRVGDEHWSTLGSISSLAFMYTDQGRYDEAEMLLRRSLEIRRQVLGDEDAATANSMCELAAVYADQGRYDEAARLAAPAVEVVRRRSRPLARERFIAESTLARILLRQGKAAEAEEMLRRAVTDLIRRHGEHHEFLPALRTGLGMCLVELGDHEQAEPILLDAYSQLRRGRQYREEHRIMPFASAYLGTCLAERGQHEEAEPLLLDACAVLPPYRSGTSEVLTYLIDFYDAWDKPVEAAEWRARSGDRAVHETTEEAGP